MSAHKVGHRDADAEGPDNPLEHDKGSMAAPVKVPDKTEEEGHQKGVKGKINGKTNSGSHFGPVSGAAGDFRCSLPPAVIQFCCQSAVF